jgi:hypothetical protein
MWLESLEEVRIYGRGSTMVCQMKKTKALMIPWKDILDSGTKDFYRLLGNPCI